MLNERVILSLDAMATRFEIVLYGSDPGRLRAAGEEALAEVERIEAQLSIYKPDSELSIINARAADGPVRVDARLFNLLERAVELSRESGGTFDMTVAPLLQAWGFMGDEGSVPSEETIKAVRELIGMHHIILDKESLTVHFDREGVRLDPGAIGKGYGVERAAEILQDIGITSALIHGGTSTVYAIGSPPDKNGWPVAIRHPVEEGEFLSIISLCDSSLSISSVQGKSFSNDEREFGHVIDPRNGMPTQAALTTAVIGPSPTDCDALSTALLVLGEPGIAKLSENRPDYRFLVATLDSETMSVMVNHTSSV